MTPDAPTPERPVDELDPAVAAVGRWRRELVETGGPNTLLWRAADQSGRLELTHAHPAGLAIFLSGRDTRLSDLAREPRTFGEALEVARRIRATDERLWEERGLATCFLAAGMVTWRMPGPRQPSAPVFLRPCTLVPRDVGQTDFDVVVSRTTELNPAFVELVRAELGVELDGPALAARSWGRNGFDPEGAYRELTLVCSRLPGLSIERRLGIGIYPYAKLAMVADLADATVAGHPLVRAMAGLPTTLRPPTESPAPLPTVLPADAEQRAALAAIGAGDDVVVQGAPGTGMTQVVANAVAGLAAQGRSVLLVSHKRAATEAVRHRLLDLGLDLVVEAHDGPDLRGQHGPLTTVPVPSAVTAQRETVVDLHDATEILQGRLQALHQVREPWGVSAFQAQGALVELCALDPAPHSRVRLDPEALRALTPQLLDVATRQLVQAAAAGAWLTTGRADPWRNARVLTQAQADEALAACERLVSEEGLPRLRALAGAVADEAGLPQGATTDEIGADLDLVAGVRGTLDVFVPEIYDAPLPDMLAATSAAYRAEHGSSLGLVRRGALKREARQLLRPGPPPRDLHALLAVAHDQATAWRDRAGAAARPAVPHGIDEARAAHRAVQADLDLLAPVLRTTDGAGDLASTPLDELQRHLQHLVDDRSRLAVLPAVTEVLDEMRDLGLGPVVEDLARRHVPSDQVAAEVRHVWWCSLLEHVRATDPRYGRHDGASAHAVADELPRLEARAMRERAQAISRATRGASPCRAVSPYEVGALVDQGQVVDTVILLEASQLSVAQAVSAVSRGRQVVVCGDQQQLPPAELSLAVGEPEDDVLADQRACSVLSVLAARLPVHTLRTHHRSVDDRLSVLLDDQLYVEEPVTVPPATPRRALHLEHVEVGAQERARLAEAPVTTVAEVERVVRLVLAHARSPHAASLGVVTLHPRHAAAIRARLLDELARLEPGDPTTAFFDPARREPFFVKHVDDVQGDTRDEVLLAVGYGLDEAGRAGHRFGSLSMAMGERRVALAVTRARHRLTMVSTLDADQVERLGLGTGGVELLTEVLRLAETPPGRTPSQGGLTDPVMVELAGRLRASGLEVTERAGRGVGPVELAVRDPRVVDGAAVAVESDGVVYAQQARPVDRDVLRPALLERWGWTPVRVWTTDLFTAPERDVARIVEATRRARPAGRS